MTKNRLNRSSEMELMHEAMARAHMSARLEQAREHRRAAILARAHHLARRAERKALKARLLLARSL
jgi:hypothetical protein